MAERTTITQVTQWGPETTPGTLVPATKLMSALEITPGEKFTFDTFVPSGNKYASIVVPGKEWLEAKIKGYPTFTEIVYLLSSLFGAATITTPSGGTSSRLWTFTPSTTQPDTPQTYTIEFGSSVRAFKFGFSTVTGMGITFDREKISLDGDILAQPLTDNITLTSSLPTIALQPVLAKQIQMCLDTSAANFGNTVMPRFLSGAFNFTNKYGPLWVVNSANSSWVAIVELMPKPTFKLKLEADANGMTPLTNARAGSTQWIQLQALGNSIENPTIAAPTVAAGSSGLPNGAYKCAVTFVTALGETEQGTEATVTVTSDQIAWSNIPTGPAGTIGRNLYRTAPSGLTGTEKRLTSGTTLADNTTTVYTDNISDATIASNAATPTANTSGLLDYELTLQMACKVSGVQPFGDDKGVYAIEYDMEIVNDTVWGHALEIMVQNTLTAL
jgi:hypothetical protein